MKIYAYRKFSGQQYCPYGILSSIKIKFLNSMNNLKSTPCIYIKHEEMNLKDENKYRN